MRAPWKRRGKREEDDRPAVVIGTQMAAAIEAEKRHQSVPRDASPLADIRYDASRGELDLFRFSESPTDQIIGAEVESVFVAGVDAIAQLRAALTQGDLYTLLTFSRRQALLALRQESADAVTVGFRSLVLVDLERIDWRDGAVAAGLLAYAGRRVGVPVRDLVSEIITRAEQRMADVLSRHSAAPAEGLAVGGYREVRTSQGVGLAQDHGHSYAPSVDLISIAERVIALIERDEYRVDNLTTGSDLPAVWLPGADAEAAKAREGLRGCLSVSARPKDYQGGMPDHMFSVWIAQAATTDEAEAIAAAAKPKAGSDIALLGVASGTSCSVLVARSVVKGVPPLEDMNSIERFRVDLNAALTPRLTGA